MGTTKSRVKTAGNDPFLDMRKDESRTDLGNAKCFVVDHGDTTAFVQETGQPLCWDRRRWHIGDHGEAVRRVLHTIEGRWREARSLGDGHTKSEALKWAAMSAGSNRIAAVLTLAKSLLPISVADLNRDAFKLNTPSGTIDLRTGIEGPHRREDFITTLCPTPFENRRSEAWEKFLSDIFLGREHLIRWVQKYLGYCVCGDVREDLLVIWHGCGGNGKTTLLEIIFHVLGEDYAAAGAPDLLMAKKGESHPTSLADLFGKRFVACSETGAEKRLDEELVKRLTGGDAIKARRMREDFWSFRPTHKLVIITNHKPAVRNLDDAMRRRIRLVPFDARFTNPDRSLRGRLRDEAPAILGWLVEGCLAWQREGLGTEDCREVEAATEEFFVEQDVVGQFIEEGCLTGERFRVRGNAFFEALKEWCNDTGRAAPGSRRTGEYMRSHYDVKTSAGVWYLGVGLKA